jgi:hypothetical protein
MIETYSQLKDWLFYEMKMPPNINARKLSECGIKLSSRQRLRILGCFGSLQAWIATFLKRALGYYQNRT